MRYLGSLYVKDVLSFTYVQAVIFVAVAWTAFSLSSEKKNSVSYCLLAGGSAIVAIIPWIESTACQNIAVKFGGHLIYDTAIGLLLAIITNYILVYRYYSGHSSPTPSKVTDKVSDADSTDVLTATKKEIVVRF
jgi:hypothetical protein